MYGRDALKRAKEDYSADGTGQQAGNGLFAFLPTGQALRSSALVDATDDIGHLETHIMQGQGLHDLAKLPLLGYLNQ